MGLLIFIRDTVFALIVLRILIGVGALIGDMVEKKV